MRAGVCLAALALACAMPACKRSPTRSETGTEAKIEAQIEASTGADTAATPGTSAAWREPVPEGLPAAADIHRTTAPDLAVADLDGRIANGLTRLERTPPPVAAYADLIPLLMVRARFLGRMDDHERALAAAKAWVEARPRSADAYLARARVYSSVHRFADALADIDTAHTLGASPSASRSLRIVIWQATGALDQALALCLELVERNPTLDTLGMLAGLYAELGQYDRAGQTFARALAAYRDVSPYPLAWLLFQWGRMYEQSGQLGRARYLYQIARDRLPRYAELTGHLAGVLAATGEVERAAALLRELHSDHPELLGQLAAIEDRLGHGDRARALRVRATAGFDALLARFPEAWADHAARYHLDTGDGPARALALARKNLEVRDTPAARALAIEAALAADAAADACALADAGTATSQAGHAGKALLFQAWRAYTACGQRQRADELAAVLGMDDSAAP